MESELAIVVTEWQFSMRAKNLSPATIRSYLEAATRLDAHLASTGVTELADISSKVACGDRE